MSDIALFCALAAAEVSVAVGYLVGIVVFAKKTRRLSDPAPGRK